MKKKNLVKETKLPLFEPLSKAAVVSPEPSSFQMVKRVALLPVAIAESSPYGVCRCGELITIPGLDGYLCSECGWVGKILGGRCC